MRVVVFAGRTIRPAVFDELIRQSGPQVPGNNLHEVVFNLLGVRVVGKAEDAGEASDVRINGNAENDPVDI